MPTYNGSGLAGNGSDFPGWPGSDEWANWYYNYVPEAGYGSWLQGMGLGVGQGRASDPFRAFVQGLYGQYQNDYKAAAGRNPNLQWMDYLGGQNPMNDWLGMSPQQRGENPGRFNPRMRWVF